MRLILQSSHHSKETVAYGGSSTVNDNSICAGASLDSSQLTLVAKPAA